MLPKVIPVAVSGGSGSRLWPLSTDERPKQFHSFGAPGSLLQETVRRLDAVEGVELLAPILVCNRRHAAVGRQQMEAVGHGPALVIAEPFGRNTAAVAMAASLAAREIDPDALILLMPSDHVIQRPEALSRRVGEAAGLAVSRFVLFGIVPDAPETGFGYIEPGGTITGPLSEVARFVEKPSLATAKRFLADGRYLWNGGLFLFAPSLLIEEMERLAPEIATATRRAFEAGRRSGGLIELEAHAFEACPSVSIDYAVMERTDKAAVIPLDAGWTDIGSWSALWEGGAQDAQGNVANGEVEALDTEGCLLWAEDKILGVVGLKDLVVVQAGDAVIVLPKSRAQDVKFLVERFKSRGRI